jgi:transcriptional regulator PpsR
LCQQSWPQLLRGFVIETVTSTAASAPRFMRPFESLDAIDPVTASALIASSSDVALVVDAEGVILDVAFSNADLAKGVYQDWIGRPWVDTVTIESRSKIAELIRDTANRTASRWRQVNYPAVQGPDVPIRHAAIRYGVDRRLVVVGRDLRAMAALQQRLVEAQQAMEQEYARIRGAERRYRLLFQLASEAVLIVDASNERIVEANPAAAVLSGQDVKKLIGTEFVDLFDNTSEQAARSFVGALKVAPRVDNVHLRLAVADESVLLSGSLFRQQNSAHLLVVLSRLASAAPELPPDKSILLRVVEKIPDAIVVTDMDRRVLTANSAFLDSIQVANLGQVKGEPLERWIGRPAVDIELLFANLRAHGVVRHFSTILRGEFGSTEDIEISAIAIPEGPQSCLGFTIRSSGWRAGRDQLGGRELPRTVEQFTHLVGRVPLKNLVRETTDLIERLCIKAALELTRDNRASAADILGLSRQGLYAKLRRYGLGDLDDDERPSD